MTGVVYMVPSQCITWSSTCVYDSKHSPDLCVCFACGPVCNGQVYQFGSSFLVAHSLLYFVARSADVVLAVSRFKDLRRLCLTVT